MPLSTRLRTTYSSTALLFLFLHVSHMKKCKHKQNGKRNSSEKNMICFAHDEMIFFLRCFCTTSVEFHWTRFVVSALYVVVRCVLFLINYNCARTIDVKVTTLQRCHEIAFNGLLYTYCYCCRLMAVCVLYFASSHFTLIEFTHWSIQLCVAAVALLLIGFAIAKYIFYHSHFVWFDSTFQTTTVAFVQRQKNVIFII